jgi:hypothetical protein
MARQNRGDAGQQHDGQLEQLVIVPLGDAERLPRAKAAVGCLPVVTWPAALAATLPPLTGSQVAAVASITARLDVSDESQGSAAGRCVHEGGPPMREIRFAG